MKLLRYILLYLLYSKVLPEAFHDAIYVRDPPESLL
jgi:hypothetical protein